MSRSLVKIILYFSAFILMIFNLALIVLLVVKPTELNWVGWFYVVVIFGLITGLFFIMNFCEKLPDSNFKE